MADKKKTKIIIATHKKYRMPDDSMYLPLHVGAEGKESLGYRQDNTGDNISSKNPYFCELTGLYWAWKNLDCQYLGIVHYRRHFTVKSRIVIWKSRKSIAAKMKCVLHEDELRPLLEKYDMIVPNKRRYFIESLYSHYSHSHYSSHLDVAREIIEEKYPEYLVSFDKVIHRRSGYMFNMYIMGKELSDQYCVWLFDILFELERRIDMTGLSGFQRRLFGRVSEIIFNVWLDYQIKEHHYRLKEIGFLYTEPINWKRKGTAFLTAKFFNKKYDGSF